MESRIKVLFCLDYNQRTIWAAEPDEIEAYLKLFDVVIVESLEHDLTDYRRIIGSIIHCNPDTSAVQHFERLGFAFIPAHPLSVAGSCVARGGDVHSLMLKVHSHSGIFAPQRYIVGYEDLGPGSGQ